MCPVHSHSRLEIERDAPGVAYVTVCVVEAARMHHRSLTFNINDDGVRLRITRCVQGNPNLLDIPVLDAKNWALKICPFSFENINDVASAEKAVGGKKEKVSVIVEGKMAKR